MGACSSGEATSAEGFAAEPEGFEDNTRMTVVKKTDEVVEHELDADRPTDDFFDFDEEVKDVRSRFKRLAIS